MKIHLQYTTAQEKALIKEAVVLKNKTQALKSGWKFVGSGMFKRVYKKGGIVVKFASNGQCNSEGRFYFTLPPYYRKYFARIYAYADDKVVQKYYPTSPDLYWPLKVKEQAEKLIKIFDLGDVFFDIDGPWNITIFNNRPIVYDMGEEQFSYEKD